MIRPAIDADIPRLLELEQSIIASERPFDPYLQVEGTTYYDLDELIRGAHTHLIVAENAGTVIGCGYAKIADSKKYHVFDTYCYLGFIYVEPEFRGKGLASRIIDVLVVWGKSQNLQKFQLQVFSNNESAVKAYQKAGFAHGLVEMHLQVD